MKTIVNPLTLQALGDIDIEDWTPQQQSTSLTLLKGADTYRQACVKFPALALFHSYAEYIYALWLESRADVIRFVPQPYQLRYNKKHYIPDCFVETCDKRTVIELKARNSQPWLEPELVNAFFSTHHMDYVVIDNDEALAHETEALHWRPIIQALAVANTYELSTREEELSLLQQFHEKHDHQIGDLLSPLQRLNQSSYEIALYRLLHTHKLHIDLSVQRLNYDTPVSLCI
jgi:hypothetical protein